MPYIELSETCGESTYRGRFLEYHVRRTRPRRWNLEIRVNVVYRWAFEYAGKWDEGRKAAFRAALAFHARRTWSGQFVLRNGDPDDGGSVGVDVSVEVVEKWHRANDTWQVIVYPERAGSRVPDRPDGFDEPDEPIRCAPRWTGWPDDLPRPVRPEDRLHRAGVCFLYERSVRIASVRQDDPRVQRASDHELGHMLGMAHPGGICSDRDECYGRDATRDRIMGMGMTVTRADYAFATGIMHRYSNASPGQRSWWAASR
ncbi:MAG: hypothetical protein RLO52_33235 [Sandaracinaceae bacterium]